MKLYGSARSPYVRKVRIVLGEKKIACDFDEYENRKDDPRYVQMSPYKLIPILEIGPGTFLYESTVINEYLEETHPSPKLMPDDPKDRAVVRLWEDFADAHLAPALVAVFRDRFEFGPAGIVPKDQSKVDQIAAKEHLAAAESELDRLEKHLAHRDYVAGPGKGSYTLADVTLAPFLFGTASRLKLDITDQRPNITGWINRIGERRIIQEIFR